MGPEKDSNRAEAERPNGEKMRPGDTHSSLWINRYLKLNLLNFQLQQPTMPTPPPRLFLLN